MSSPRAVPAWPEVAAAAAGRAARGAVAGVASAAARTGGSAVRAIRDRRGLRALGRGGTPVPPGPTVIRKTVPYRQMSQQVRADRSYQTVPGAHSLRR